MVFVFLKRFLSTFKQLIQLNSISMDLNRITLMGHASSSPERKQLDSGSAVTKVSLATNYAWRVADTNERKEKVDFHTIIAWNKLGDRIAQYIKKGDRMYIEGRVNYRTFTGKDGTPKYVTDVVADKLIMLGKKPATSAKQEKEEVITVETDPVVVPFA